jgi:hypothetical protein
MKVKIGNKIYDSNDEPIMLILDDIDKKNINNMTKDSTKFISFPDKMNVDEIKKWVNDFANQKEKKEVPGRKLKIAALDPLGCELSKMELDYGYLGWENPPELSNDFWKPGYEPMRQVRYLLEVGEYSYYMRRNGELIDYVSGPKKITINIEE